MEILPMSSSAWCFLYFLLIITQCFASIKSFCHSEERLALLEFKNSFVLNNNNDLTCSSSKFKLGSWKNEGGNDDCCLWDGIECDRNTGYVIGLDLSDSCLYGSIDFNSSLFKLVHLQKLNLAFNDFNHSEIPQSIGKLSELRYLNFSASAFSGQIPFAISKLYNLKIIYLSDNIEEISRQPLLKLWNPDLRTLVLNLTSLEKLDLTYVDISSTVPDFPESLKFLVMKKCNLKGKFPEKIFQLPNIEVINLWYNPHLNGHLPNFDSRNPLKELELGMTGFFGEVPFSIGNLSSLTVLSLYQCEFSGLIPYPLGNLIELKSLDLTGNNFSGQIPSSLVNLTKLNYLRLNGNRLINATNLSWLNMLSNLQYLSLSSINLHGNAAFSCFDNLTKLEYLSVSRTQMSGYFPLSIKNMSSLVILGMAENDMTGMLPQWLGNFSKSLKVLDLGGNKFDGSIPDGFEKGNQLRYINLRENQFEGKLPKSLSNCEKLEVLDLGSNKLNDVFPSWLGNLKNLRALVLKSNQLHGPIGEPKTNSEFPKMHIIDLSENNFSNSLPVKYINNWNAMKSFSSYSMYINVILPIESNPGEFIMYYYAITIINKGSKTDFNRLLDAFSVINLSNNRFDGQIPDFIGNLEGLQALNLSHNLLTGSIPSSLGELKNLEVLDLSNNKLSGIIPQKLSQLTFLAIFNVSYNQLSGQIPQGHQFGNMDFSSFEGNPNLCGKQLSNKCGDDKVIQQVPSSTLEEDDGNSFFEFGWKIVLIGYGCGVVFGFVAGNFIIKWKQDWFSKTFGRISQSSKRGRKWRRR